MDSLAEMADLTDLVRRALVPPCNPAKEEALFTRIEALTQALHDELERPLFDALAMTKRARRMRNLWLKGRPRAAAMAVAAAAACEDQLQAHASGVLAEVQTIYEEVGEHLPLLRMSVEEQLLVQGLAAQVLAGGDAPAPLAEYMDALLRVVRFGAALELLRQSVHALKRRHRTRLKFMLAKVEALLRSDPRMRTKWRLALRAAQREGEPRSSTPGAPDRPDRPDQQELQDLPGVQRSLGLLAWGPRRRRPQA